MIGRIEARLRWMRRAISRSEWAIGLLGASRATGGPTERGLLFVQIDGFAKVELERALAAGRMRYLGRLLTREHYVLRPLYSGVPSTTAAAQAELFYGIPTAVPAFGFQHSDFKRAVRMFEPEVASRIEAELAAKTPGLLEGGSAFSNILGGGAKETRFCAATLGRVETKSIGFALVLALHAPALLRIAWMTAVEACVAVRDCVKGLIAGRDLARELRFVLTRVAVNGILREICVIGASIDAARGLPIIHVNFVGYDEQAHRRGPSSAFAHWSLKGIDRAIQRVAGAARRSARRDFEVWVYSDHGQENVVPFSRETGRSIEDVVVDLVRSIRDKSARVSRAAAARGRKRRTTQLGPRSRHLEQPTAEPAGEAKADEIATVVADGPLGFVYVPGGLPPEVVEELARALVTEGVPIVLAPIDDGAARAFTATGEHELPRDAAAVLGDEHPYLTAAATDLAAVCHHPHAGLLVLSGWRANAKPMSFAAENGAHGGPGSAEVGAFAILPDDAPVASVPGRDYLRMLDLHHGALTLLERTDRSLKPTRRARAPRGSATLRVMTYNVHSCVGMDGRISTSRISRVIARHQPDIVALQELDVQRHRTGRIDQAEAIAKELEMRFQFHAAIHVEEERYGNAIFTRLPMRLVRAEGLPRLPIRQNLEPRGALWIAIEFGGAELNFVTTHLGLSRRERLHHTEVLLGPSWLGHPDCRPPFVLCGDFNDGPKSATLRRFQGLMRDAQVGLDGRPPRNTWLARFPLARIDHVLVSRGIEVDSVEVPRTELTRTSSDHLPLVVDLRMEA